MVLPEGLVLGGFCLDDRGSPGIPSQAGVEMKLTVHLRSQDQCLSTSPRRAGLQSVLLPDPLDSSEKCHETCAASSISSLCTLIIFLSFVLERNSVEF